MANVELPIEIGQLKTTALISLHIYNNEDGTKGADVEFMDQMNTTYMGVPIEGYTNWRKFLEFHKEMGINFSDLIGDKVDEVFTEEFTAEFIKDIKF